MSSSSHSPSLARCLLIATLFTLGFLATISLSDSYASRSLQKHAHSPRNDPPAPSHEKRLLGLGGVVGILPSLLGHVVPGGIASSLIAQVTADINSLLPILDELNAQSSDGVPLVTGGQDMLPLTAQPLPTGAQLGGLADKLGGLLNDIVPVAAPSIIAAITEQALSVVVSVEAIATDVASLGNQIAGDQIQAPDALDRIGGLLGSLDSKVNDIINGVASDLSSDIPLPVLQDLSQLISSGLGDIVGAANGPLSLVGNLVEQNVCGVVTLVDGVLATVAGLCGDIPSAVAQISSEIATAPLTNPDATLTGDVSASTISPNSPAITGGQGTVATSTPSPQTSQDQGTLTSPTQISATPGGASAPKSSLPSVSPLGPGSTGGVLFTPPSSAPSTNASVPGAAGQQSSTVITSLPSIASSGQPGAGGASQITTTGGRSDGVVSLLFCYESNIVRSEWGFHCHRISNNDSTVHGQCNATRGCVSNLSVLRLSEN